MAKLLLEAGADPAAADASGRTPLHVALLANADACVTLLLRDRNTNVNAKTIAPLAAGGAALVPARSLRSTRAPANAHANDKRAGCSEQCDEADLEDEADAACGVGLTPLMVAVKCSCELELVRCLLHTDCDCNLQDSLGTRHFLFHFHFHFRSHFLAFLNHCSQQSAVTTAAFVLCRSLGSALGGGG